MSSQIQAARPVRIASIEPQLVSQKLRIAGRILAYNREDAILLIAYGSDALFVDISLWLDPSKFLPWLEESNNIVMVLGYLEERTEALPLPTLPLHARDVEVDPHLVVSALLVSECPDLDIDMWNRSIVEREKSERSI